MSNIKIFGAILLLTLTSTPRVLVDLSVENQVSTATEMQIRERRLKTCAAQLTGLYLSELGPFPLDL